MLGALKALVLARESTVEYQQFWKIQFRREHGVFADRHVRNHGIFYLPYNITMKAHPVCKQMNGPECSCIYVASRGARVKLVIFRLKRLMRRAAVTLHGFCFWFQPSTTGTCLESASVSESRH